ncbi:MAG: hypothetical protein ACI8RZ_004783 [Myxococcota bacterium]|jgi:hypothetical protein
MTAWLSTLRTPRDITTALNTGSLRSAVFALG